MRENHLKRISPNIEESLPPSLKQKKIGDAENKCLKDINSQSIKTQLVDTNSLQQQSIALVNNGGSSQIQETQLVDTNSLQQQSIALVNNGGSSQIQETLLVEGGTSDLQRTADIYSSAFPNPVSRKKCPKRSLNNSENESVPNKKPKLQRKNGTKSTNKTTGTNSSKPKPSNKKISVEKKGSSSVKRSTVSGEHYQRLLQILVRQRSLGSPGSKIGIEVPGVGDVDDIVSIKRHNSCRFFQIKHSKKAPLYRNELFKLFNSPYKYPEKERKEKIPPNLHVILYFNSYCTIKNSESYKNIEEITLVTNRILKEAKDDQAFMGFLVKENIDDDYLLKIKNKTIKPKYKNHETQVTKYRFSADLVANHFEEAIRKWGLEGFEEEEALSNTIKEFIEKVRVVVSYPDIGDIQEVIFKEVFDELLVPIQDYPILHSHMLQMEIQLLMIKLKGDIFLTNEQWKYRVKKVKDSVNKIKTIGVTDSEKACLSWRVGDIHFNKDSLKQMITDIGVFLGNDESKMLQIYNVHDVELNAFKVLNVINKLGNENESNIKKEEIISVTLESVIAVAFIMESFKVDKTRTLLVWCENENINGKKIDSFVVKLLQALKKNKKKKCIFISNSKDFLKKHLPNPSQQSLIQREYSHGFKDLKPHSKETMLNKTINFQGSEVPLRQLFQDNTSFAEDVLDEGCMWEILDERNPCSVLNIDYTPFISDGYDQDYYIPRRFFQNRVTYETLKSKMETILFFITGILGMDDTSIKTSLKAKGIPDQDIKEFTNYESIENGIILPGSFHGQYKTIFKTLTKKKAQVQWLFMNKEDLFLVNSSPPVKRNPTSPAGDKEEIFVTSGNQDSNNIFIVVGDSGDGKSTVLTSIANQYKTALPSAWIVKINLRRVFSTKTGLRCVDKDTAIDMLQEMIFPCQGCNFEKKLFKEGLKLSDRMKIVLLFDGFNEIAISSQNKMCNLINTLKRMPNIHQCWVTTQPQDKHTLEENLNLPAYILKKLYETDQIYLMTEYWALEYSKKKETFDKDELHRDATAALDKLKGVKDKSFTATPLNLKMLADVLLHKNNQRKFDGELSLLQLYKSFVQYKFVIYTKETIGCIHCYNDPQMTDVSKIVSQLKETLFIQSITKILEEISVKRMFQGVRKIKQKTVQKLPGMTALEEMENIKNSLGTQNEVTISSTLSKIGFLTFRSSGELDFTHYNYTQYFFNKYAVKHLDNNIIRNFVVNNVLEKKSFQVCRTFFNNELMLNKTGSGHINSISINQLKNKLNKLKKLKIIKLILDEEKHSYITSELIYST